VTVYGLSWGDVRGPDADEVVYPLTSLGKWRGMRLSLMDCKVSPVVHRLYVHRQVRGEKVTEYMWSDEVAADSPKRFQTAYQRALVGGYVNAD
jgi:hypothetical protein